MVALAVGHVLWPCAINCRDRALTVGRTGTGTHSPARPPARPPVLQVDQCIDTGVSYGEAPTPGSCTPLEATVHVGEPGKTYIVL